MTRPLSICIVTCDIVGPIRNGGIGTAYYNLALALARAGHSVTVLYALGQYCERRTIAYWRRVYARKGISLIPLPASNVKGHGSIKMAAGVYEWIKDRQFDIVHCHEWRGIGFYMTQAKRQGLCLERSVICVGAHSPTLWHREGMAELATAEDLEVDFMERQSVALADVLWSPSRHMIAWMRREGWRLPAEIRIRPYILLDTPRAASAMSLVSSPELVFFGRLETRKGLDLFCDALDRLVKRGVVPASVTFLGKTSTVLGTPSDEYLRKRSEKWPFAWKIVSDCDRHQAMEYLREPWRIAVLPSKIDNYPYTVLECLGAGVPFVAAATGGIPEMIRPRDRDRVLFDLTAESLAEKLTSVLQDGLCAVPLRVSVERTLAEWLVWHTRKAGQTPKPVRRATGRPPLVSVCITHRNRPAFLKAALATLRRQTYPRIEVVLVDDGSDDPAAVTALDRIEREFRGKGWTLIRQTNRYLGAARNAAIAAASGDYILFMDDDNLAERHEIATFVQAAIATGADILTCFLGVFQSSKPAPPRRTHHVWPFLGGAIAPGLLRNAFGDANALVRRDVFDRIGGFTEDFGVGCEDWEFFARAALRGLSIQVVPEPLVRYRQAPTGMLNTTSRHANRMRALRPYFSLLPAHLRPMVHLVMQDMPGVAEPSAPAPAALDHVQRAVVFGSGEAGRLAIGLAKRCGWSVPWIVDNNPSAWNTTAHGLSVHGPDALSHGGFDLVIIASLAGKPAISAQLTKLGFSQGEQFVHFLDAVQVGGFTTQVRL